MQEDTPTVTPQATGNGLGFAPQVRVPLIFHRAGADIPQDSGSTRAVSLTSHSRRGKLR